jgi:hypothetical protein
MASPPTVRRVGRKLLVCVLGSPASDLPAPPVTRGCRHWARPLVRRPAVQLLPAPERQELLAVLWLDGQALITSHKHPLLAATSRRHTL